MKRNVSEIFSFLFSGKILNFFLGCICQELLCFGEDALHAHLCTQSYLHKCTPAPPCTHTPAHIHPQIHSIHYHLLFQMKPVLSG